MGWLAAGRFIHRSILLAHTGLAGLPEILMDLFVQLDGVPVNNQKLIDIGVLPWWSLETLQLAFWRPLTALTHWFDYVLWPNFSVPLEDKSLRWLKWRNGNYEAFTPPRRLSENRSRSEGKPQRFQVD